MVTQQQQHSSSSTILSSTVVCCSSNSPAPHSPTSAAGTSAASDCSPPAATTTEEDRRRCSHCRQLHTEMRDQMTQLNAKLDRLAEQLTRVEKASSSSTVRGGSEASRTRITTSMENGHRMVNGTSSTFTDEQQQQTKTTTSTAVVSKSRSARKDRVFLPATTTEAEQSGNNNRRRKSPQALMERLQMSGGAVAGTPIAVAVGSRKRKPHRETLHYVQHGAKDAGMTVEHQQQAEQGYLISIPCQCHVLHPICFIFGTVNTAEIAELTYNNFAKLY